MKINSGRGKQNSMLELILLKKQTPSLFNSAGPYDGFHELGEGIIDVKLFTQNRVPS